MYIKETDDPDIYGPEDHHPPANENTESYGLSMPAGMGEKVPSLIISCPHASGRVPAGFTDRLIVNEKEFIGRSDLLTRRLVEQAGREHAAVIAPNISPSVINAGRKSDSIYPGDVKGGVRDLPWNPGDQYCGKGQGQGLVMVKTLSENPVWAFKPGQHPDEAEIKTLIDTYYTPYHNRLERLVEDSLKQSGNALVFDVHSCPSTGPSCDSDHGQERPQIIISNLEGKSCSSGLVEKLATIAQKHCLTFKINDPYKGGFITQKFGAHAQYGPLGGRAIQIEFNRKTALGIDEEKLMVTDPRKFTRTQRCVHEMIEVMAQHIS
jgi:N-formylglutamate amidohydrolase